MSGEQYADKAVAALKARLDEAFETELAAVETATGMATGDLGRPLEIITAHVEHDNRAPLLAVWDDGLAPVSQKSRLWAVECLVAMTMLGGAEVTSNAQLLRRWVSAFINVITGDPTLGGRVVAAVLGQGAARPIGDESATRLAYVFPVQVRVQS